MDPSDKSQWLAWTQKLPAIAQAGLEYSPDTFDRERFSRLRRMAVEMTSVHTGIGDNRLIAVLDRNRYTDDRYPYSVSEVVVACTPVGGTFRPNIETSEARYFSEDEVPELSVLRNTREQVETCYAFEKGRTTDVRFD